VKFNLERPDKLDKTNQA